MRLTAKEKLKILEEYDKNLNRESEVFEQKPMIFSSFPSFQRRHVKDKKRLEEVYADLEENHNHSWITEIFRRNLRKNDNRAALFYRGTTVTYQEMFDKVKEVAKALRAQGIGPGDRVAMCVSNCPEMVYTLGALNMIGAVPNVFGEGFSKDYIEEIVNKCNPKLMIATDNLYGDIKDVIDKTHIEKKVVISLADSASKGSNYFYNKVNSFQKADNKVFSFEQFKSLGKGYKGKIYHKMGLHDTAIITYTSGSTKDGRPKAIAHANNSFITSARFHDSDLSRLPSTEHIRGLAHIPPHSNTDLITSISDVLSQGGTVALEPTYNKETFAYSLLINKPNFVPATTSFWIHAIKAFQTDPSLKDKKLPYLYIPTAVGEAVSPGEEKFINRGLKKLKAGIDKLKVTTAPLSMGGGDCEHGGLFFRLYKSFYDKLPITKNPRGLRPFQMAEPVVLREDGTECYYNEIGRLATNSRCTMQGYVDNPEANEKFYIKDAYGRMLADNKVWAYIDAFGDVHMKGRIGNELKLETGEELPLFMIADAVLKDTKNVLSCEVVLAKDENMNDVPVAHIELQPNSKKPMEKVLASAAYRVSDYCGSEVVENLYFRPRDYSSSFPLTGCGKRSAGALEQEGISHQAFRVKECYFDKPKQKVKKKSA